MIFNEFPQTPPYKELSRVENKYLEKQLFYFFPFVRSLYEAINRQESGTAILHPVNPMCLNDIKGLSIYYANSLVYGDFNLEKEQKLIDSLNKNIGLDSHKLSDLIESIPENTFNKSDGFTSHYLFGSKPTQEMMNLDLPGSPYYEMGLSGGILTFEQKNRYDLVESMSTYMSANNEDGISIFGNVSRGIVDAAALHIGLQRKKVKSNLHFFRSSTHAMDDNKAIIINENYNPHSWGIVVDSFTAKGMSVPHALKMLEETGFKKKSLFLTNMGYEWARELGVEHQWDNRHGEGNYAGTLLHGDYSKIPARYKK